MSEYAQHPNPMHAADCALCGVEVKSASELAPARGSAYVGLDELASMLNPIESFRVGMRLLAAIRLMRTLDREHLQRLSDACLTEERSMPNAPDDRQPKSL